MKTVICLTLLVLVCEVSSLYTQNVDGKEKELAEKLFELLEGDIIAHKSPSPVIFDEPELDIPEEDSELFEGDIRIPQSPHRAKRNALADKGKLWPNGVIPYTISHKFNSTLRNMFKSSMKMIEEATRVDGKSCIEFVPRTLQKDYVQLQMFRGCSSELGRKGEGKQLVSLGRQCYSEGTVVHELMHTVGFFHEQSRTDRNFYIDVHYENVRQGTEINFEPHPNTKLDTLSLPYDYDSIMHYKWNSFSRNPKLPTITPKIKLTNGVVLGQRDHLSVIDIQMVQKLYGCKSDKADAVETNGQCKDKLENCYMYGQHACTTLPKWAEENCALTCKICTPVCEDKIPECYRYRKSVCSGQYQPWAVKNCPKWCGLGDCAIKTTTPEPIQIEEESEPSTPACADKMDCTAFPKSVCSLFSHMKDNCAKYCSLCTEEKTTTTAKPTTTTKATTRHQETCGNKISDCQAYSSSVCTSHPDWARENCAMFCSICKPAEEKTTTTAKPTTTTKATTRHQEICGNKISDCQDYSSSVCTSHPDWARENCAMFCSICKPAVTTTTTTIKPGCADARDDCADFGAIVCTNYAGWSRVNCQKFCGICKPEVTTPTTVESKCFDVRDDCNKFGQNVCANYAEWSQANCPMFCGMCDKQTVAKKECSDKRDDCSSFSMNVCTNIVEWSRENCQEHCGLC